MECHREGLLAMQCNGATPSSFFTTTATGKWLGVIFHIFVVAVDLYFSLYFGSFKLWSLSVVFGCKVATVGIFLSLRLLL